MVHSRELIEALGRLTPIKWEGSVFRHMFSNFPPERENTSGARWNPPQTPAVYASLDRATAFAEAEYYINLQPLRPKVRRVIYQIEISLDQALDLSNWEALKGLGLQRDAFASTDYSESQKIGGASEWLEHDGILVPSARADGVNLVLFPNRRREGSRFEVVSKEEIV